MCHTLILDIKHIAVNKADKYLHPPRVYNLVGMTETR